MFNINSFSWDCALRDELNEPYGRKLKAFISEQVDLGRTILPFPGDSFKSFDLTPLWGVKCVIVGNEPYSARQFSSGLAYAVPHLVEKKDWPISLRNINRALKVDLGLEIRSPDLYAWAMAGVLLLNRTLTVEEGKPGSHKGIGWERFTDALMRHIIDSGRPVIWVLWGQEAQDSVMPMLAELKAVEKGHEIVTAPKPTEGDGFVWHKPFSKINEFCESRGYSSITWGEKVSKHDRRTKTIPPRSSY